MTTSFVSRVMRENVARVNRQVAVESTCQSDNQKKTKSNNVQTLYGRDNLSNKSHHMIKTYSIYP